MVNGVGMEWTHKYSPNDDGTPNTKYSASVTPATKTFSNNTYIMTERRPMGNDLTIDFYYLTNVGGKLISYTGSSASNWKIPSFHIDWVANGNGSRNLLMYYSFGGSNGGFSKVVNGGIWTWYSQDCSGSKDVTSVSSTSAGLPIYTGWSGAELHSGSILIGIAFGSSSYTTAFYIRNMWFDTNTWI